MTGSAIVMIGCGRMGGAILRGLQSSGAAGEVWILDPAIEAAPGASVVHSIAELPPLAEATVLLAVKPQVAASVLPSLAPLVRAGAVVVSIVAGVPIAALRAGLGGEAAVVRTIPNTPAAVLRGITAAVAGPGVSAAQRARSDALLAAVGDVVWLEDEALIDAVTALSGSGPAYFYRFTEALAEAGVSLGLPPEIAERLARRTFEGAGALAASTSRSLAELRAEVTSPAGTTAAGLAVMDAEARLQKLAEEVVRAARDRAVDLGRSD